MLKSEKPYLSDFANNYYEEGRQDGERRVLRTMLTLKFGTLSHEVEQRLTLGTTEDIDRWTARILTAASINDVFRAR